MEAPLTRAEIIIFLVPFSLVLLAFFIPSTGGTPGRLQKIDLFWIFFGIVLGASALWALTDAIVTAVQSGTVSLPGRRGHPRPVVQWPASWAYLSGLVCLVLSIVMTKLPRRSNGGRFWLRLRATLIAFSGYLLILLSPMLSSWEGVGIMASALIVGAALALSVLISR